MKINSKIITSAMLSVLFPFIVGLSVVMAAMMGEYRNKERCRLLYGAVHGINF